MDKMQEEVKKKNVGEIRIDNNLKSVIGTGRKFWAVVVGTDYNLSLQAGFIKIYDKFFHIRITPINFVL